jgi:hypothetical protein
MNRDNEAETGLEELGSVSLDTQGPPGAHWEITGPDRYIGIAAD